MENFISDNIITRDQALTTLMDDPMLGYFIGVAVLAIICWRMRHWL
jgi:hypothetical protein